MRFTGPGIQTAQLGAYYIPQPAARARRVGRAVYPVGAPALGSAFPFDPNVTPHWGESCPPGYGGVPPYCWMLDPQTGLPTYPGAPGTETPATTVPNGTAVTPAPAATATPAAAQAAPTASWWAGLETWQKAALIGGAGLTGYLLVTLLRRQPATARYTPNLRQVARRTPSGVPLVRGKRWGHLNAPRHYRRLGFTKPSQYAYPARFMYPVMHPDRALARKHTIAAKGRFTQQKADYPMEIRRVIARNINKAARRVGLEPDVKP